MADYFFKQCLTERIKSFVIAFILGKRDFLKNLEEKAIRLSDLQVISKNEYISVGWYQIAIGENDKVFVSSLLYRKVTCKC